MKNRKEVESCREFLKDSINSSRKLIVVYKEVLNRSQGGLEDYLKMVSKYNFPIDKGVLETVIMLSNNIKDSERKIQEENKLINRWKNQIAKCEREYL